MKTLEEIKAMRDALAEAHASKVMDEGDWHSVEAGQSFILGFDKALELMEERERVAIDALQQVTGCPFTVDSATVPKIGISEAPPYQVVVVLSMAWTRLKQIRQTLEKLTKGENK